MPVSQTPQGLLVEYTEPSTTKTGTPLTDLDHTTIFFDLGSGPQKAVDVPATSANGGGAISQVIQVPVGADQEADVSITVTATDTSGNESTPSNSVAVRVDTLPPASPVLSA